MVAKHGGRKWRFLLSCGPSIYVSEHLEMETERQKYCTPLSLPIVDIVPQSVHLSCEILLAFNSVNMINVPTNKSSVSEKSDV